MPNEPTVASQTKPRWIAKGTKYHDPGEVATTQSGEEKITIRECDKEIHMETPNRPDHQVYGEPIDARLAIHFIRNLWRAIDEDLVFQIYNKTKNLFQPDEKEKLEKMEKIEQKEQKEQKPDDDFSGFSKPEIKKILKSFNCFVKLLQYSAGLTASRSMLLKILSQPESRGVRFYLALKNPEDFSKKANLDDGIFTLVMVGVDDTGTDLHYEYDANNHARGDQIPKVDTTSLPGEYPAPSGAVGDDGPVFVDGKTHFPLLKYAMYK